MATKLFNQGKRVIKGDTVDGKDGKVKPYIFAPKQALLFHDDAYAAYILRMYEGELISLENVQTQFETATPATDAEQAAPMVGMPMSPAPDALSGLSEDERRVIEGMRAASAPPPPAANEPVAQPSKDPSDFVNVTEEEAIAAKAAIEAIRQKNAQNASLDAQAANPVGLLQKVRDAISGNKDAV